MKKALLGILLLLLLFGCNEQAPPADSPPESTPVLSAGPGGCQSKEECDAFCAENPSVCEEFCKEHPETCTSSESPPTEHNAPAKTAEPGEGLGLVLPLAFTYTVPMYRGEEKFERHVVFFLEKEQKCFDRNAVVGVINSYDKTEGPEQGYWAKFTLYLDNGELGSSSGIGQSGLAFDDAKAKKPEYALLTHLNCIFASGEENFNYSDAWESDIPVILKDVYYASGIAGDLVGSLSLVKKGVSTNHLIPCTEFALNMKSDVGFGNELVYCVAGLDSEILQPYTVSITFPNSENGNDVELKKIEKRGSGLAFYPQCLEPVYCPRPDSMSEEKRQECNAQGNVVQELRDSDGCLVGYECLEKLEWAKKTIIESQPPHCPEPSDEFAEEALKCIETGTDPKSLELNEQGCYVSIDCG